MSPRRRIIPVFVPHLGCPHDCVFCNQRSIAGQAEPAKAKQVIDTINAAGDDTPAELAFYGGSFTAVPAGEQEDLLGSASGFLRSGRLSGIRVSTRPDCVDVPALDRLRRYGVMTVELGSQSMDAQVLRLAGRGHTAEDTERAAGLVKAYGFELVLQMMTGLPGDSLEKTVDTARRIISLEPGAVRIYPTVIVEGTELERMWRRGDYREHSVDEAVEWCAVILPLFEAAGIPVIRLGLNPTDELSAGAALGGAYHPALGELVYSRIYLNRARELLKNAGAGDGARVTLGVNAREISKMTGRHRGNITRLTEEFKLGILKAVPAEVKIGEIILL